MKDVKSLASSCCFVVVVEFILYSFVFFVFRLKCYFLKNLCSVFPFFYVFGIYLSFSSFF